MKLSKEEYDFFNSLTSRQFYAVAFDDFDRYVNFVNNESKANKRERHKRFDRENEENFKRLYHCKTKCSVCKSRCY